MQTDLQSSSNTPRTMSLLAIVTVTAGIGLAAYDVSPGPSPAETNSARTPVASSLAQPADVKNDPSPVRVETATPRFERSNEPAVDVDTANAHGG